MIHCSIKLAELFIPDTSYVDKLQYFVNFVLYRYTVYGFFAPNPYLLTLNYALLHFTGSYVYFTQFSIILNAPYA